MNGVLVSGKSVEEIQQILDECRDHLLLEVMRCRQMTTMSSDRSQSSPFQTPSSPLMTADEFDAPCVTDVNNRTENQRALQHSDAAGDLHESDRLLSGHWNTSEPDMLSSRDSCNQVGHIKESKPNFLDKAVHAITRPFLRTKQSRARRDAHSKSAFYYVGNSSTTVDDFDITNSGQNASTTVGPCRPDSAPSHKEQSRSLPRMKRSDGGHGTWPKCQAHTAQRPSVLPLYSVKPSSFADDESTFLPKLTHHGIEIRHSESARHRPQISDSVVDYVRQVDSACSAQITSSETDVPESSTLYKNSLAVDSVTPLGPHYAKRFPDETTVTVHSRVPTEHHVTVISHFPVEHGNTEIASYGGHTKYTQRPIPHTSPFSSAGQNLPEHELLHSSGVIISSPSNRTERHNLARYSGSF